jgi:hypothetical protein
MFGFARSLDDAWLEPAASIRREPIGVRWSLTSAVVFEHRLVARQDRVDDPPRGLDSGLAPEQCPVPAERVAEEPFVRRHLIAWATVFDEAHILANHRLARDFGLCRQGNEHLRTQAEAKFVAVGVGARIEEPARRRLQPDTDVGSRMRQTFSAADQEGNARPSTILDFEPGGHIGLNA